MPTHLPTAAQLKINASTAEFRMKRSSSEAPTYAGASACRLLCERISVPPPPSPRSIARQRPGGLPWWRCGWAFGWGRCVARSASSARRRRARIQAERDQLERLLRAKRFLRVPDRGSAHEPALVAQVDLVSVAVGIEAVGVEAHLAAHHGVEVDRRHEEENVFGAQRPLTSPHSAQLRSFFPSGIEPR